MVLFLNHRLQSMRYFVLFGLLTVMALTTTGCAVVSATAGAAISVTGAVVSTAVKVTGKAIEAGIDAVSDDEGE